MTFVKGSPSKTLDAIRVKLRVVLSANPWLAGSFAPNKTLQVPLTPGDVDVNDILNTLQEDKINAKVPYPVLVSSIAANPLISVGPPPPATLLLPPS